MHRWLALVALAGAGPALLFTAAGDSQLYFWFYGYVAAAVLGSIGLMHLFDTRRKTGSRLVMAVAVLTGLLGTLLIVFQSRPGVRAIMGDRFRVFQRNPDNQLPENPARSLRTTRQDSCGSPVTPTARRRSP